MRWRFRKGTVAVQKKKKDLVRAGCEKSVRPSRHISRMRGGGKNISGRGAEGGRGGNISEKVKSPPPVSYWGGGTCADVSDKGNHQGLGSRFTVGEKRKKSPSSKGAGIWREEAYHLHGLGQKKGSSGACHETKDIRLPAEKKG